jgi:carboxynorspermidine decarboxylase
MNTNLLSQLSTITTPAYILDEAALLTNLERTADIRKHAGVKIVLATKAFAMFQSFPLMRPFLDGTTASGLFEARLGSEEFGKEVHVYAPVFADNEIRELTAIATHISFNSPAQFHKYWSGIKAARPHVSLGLRINPEFPLTSDKAMYAKYNPCAPCSRMGSVRRHVDRETLKMLEGLHFHVLCENLDAESIRLIDFVEENFGEWLRMPNIKWVNFGGGHYINDPEYQREKLIQRLVEFRNTFPNLEVILEPGGGIVRNAGYFATTVQDILENEKKIAILDSSAAAHLPDVIIAPYRPPLYGSSQSDEKSFNYVLGGKSCMTSDIFGEYSFGKPLKIGDVLIFEDMMQYSFGHNSNFNGMPIPDLAVLHKDGSYEVWRAFDYDDYKSRLGSMGEDASQKAQKLAG